MGNLIVTKHGIRVRFSRKKQRSTKDNKKNRFPNLLFDDPMEKVEALMKKEKEAEGTERRIGKEPEEATDVGLEETGPGLSSLLPLGKVHHAALGNIDDDEYGD